MHKINGICTLGIVPIRKKASHTSEMVTQLLYGEVYTYEVIPNNRDWIRITSSFDKYEGYLATNQFSPIEKKENRDSILTQNLRIVVDKFPAFLVAGSRITNKECEDLNLRDDQLLTNTYSSASPNLIIRDAKQFLNSPYLWGGRSIYGVDCSGLVQIVYLINGVNLPRDASQQIERGTIVPIETATNGDLAFFNNEQGKITHVGIVIKEDSGELQIIHASGKVRIDVLDEKGIYVKNSKTYSHVLHTIKRLI